VIELPAGKIQTRVEAASATAGAAPAILRAGVVRTARLLLAGRVFVTVSGDALAA
jgi:2-methylaconitate cis-trans-isomerase PrpF